MIHHISLYVRDYAKSKELYLKMLRPLGYEVVMEFNFPDGSVCGLGADNKADLWIKQKEQVGSTHIAFAAQNRKAVDDFYNAAIAAGAKDNGMPGIRSEYSPTYYGGFIIDPDGNNIEAVCTNA